MVPFIAKGIIRRAEILFECFPAAVDRVMVADHLIIGDSQVGHDLPVFNIVRLFSIRDKVSDANDKIKALLMLELGDKIVEYRVVSLVIAKDGKRIGKNARGKKKKGKETCD